MAPRIRVRAIACAPLLIAVVAAAAHAALPQQAGSVDLATQADVRIDGAAVNDTFGEYATSAGDFDGDGVTDLIATNAGAASAWVVFGSANGGNVSLASPGTRAIKITGATFHWAAGGQDVNGDGLSDVVLGDSAAEAAYVVFGSKSHTDVDINALGANGFKMTGAAGDGTGVSVAMAPDMSGDGKGEVVVGAFGASNKGAASVVFGTGSTATIDLPNLGSGGFRIDGASNNDGAGSVVAGGPDMTGDGVPDVLVGSPGAKFSNRATSGAVYVVAGKSSTTNVDLAALGSGGFVIGGQAPSDQLPRSLAIAGDMNGDTLGEAVVGTDFADNEGGSSGSAWVVFGRSSTTDVDLAAGGFGGFRVDGEKASDQAARSLGAPGDVNGDGKADLIVGALFADPRGRDGSGSAYVVYGTNSTSTVSLATLGGKGFRIDGAAAGDNVGRSVGAGGDFNADGRPDVVTGGEFAKNNGSSSGSVYVQYGFGQPAFSYSPGEVTVTSGTPMTPLTPTGVKRTGTATFAAASPLPPGLSLDPATGAISGTWVSGGGSGAYTVTMTDLAGTTTATVTIKLAVLVEPPPPLAGPCQNVVDGTNARNSLTGTAGGDLIQGRGGADRLFGLAGDDCLYGGAGNDALSGGGGNDKLDGGPGRDKLTGGKGKDTFTGGRGNDTINSRDGIRETVNCGKGRDRVKADKRDKLRGCERRT